MTVTYFTYIMKNLNKMFKKKKSLQMEVISWWNLQCGAIKLSSLGLGHNQKGPLAVCTDRYVQPVHSIH